MEKTITVNIEYACDKAIEHMELCIDNLYKGDDRQATFHYGCAIGVEEFLEDFGIYLYLESKRYQELRNKRIAYYSNHKEG